MHCCWIYKIPTDLDSVGPGMIMWHNSAANSPTKNKLIYSGYLLPEVCYHVGLKDVSYDS